MLGQRGRATFISVVVAATAAPCGFAPTATSASPIVELHQDIAIEVYSDYLVAARGRIGARSGLTFVVDTGSLPTLVDTRIARHFRRAGPRVPLESFTRTDALDSVVLPSLVLGSFSAADVPALADDLSRLRARFGITPDAVLGAALLRGVCFSIDYARRTLTFECRQGWTATLPLDRRSPYVVAAVTIDATSLRLVVDTGSPAVVVYAGSAPPAWRSRVDGEIEAWDFSGPVRLQRLTADMISLGLVTWPRRPVHILSGDTRRRSYDGVLGVRALGIAAVQFDLKRMVLGWE